jgi:hypothetical protein
MDHRLPYSQERGAQPHWLNCAHLGRSGTLAVASEADVQIERTEPQYSRAAEAGATLNSYF